MKSSLIPCLLALCLPLAAHAESPPSPQTPPSSSTTRTPAQTLLSTLASAPSRVVDTTGNTVPAGSYLLTHSWQGSHASFSIKNTSSAPIAIKEVVLFDFTHQLPADTAIYGEGFQKLGQTIGTLAKPIDLGSYPDRTHYKIPEPENLRTCYGMMMLSPSNTDRALIGFTSCNHFSGRISFNSNRLRISIDTENLSLAPNETWQLENFIASASPNREALYEQLTTAIAKHHPRLKHDPAPTGWCSWNCFGPSVTAKNVSDVSTWIQQNLPSLRYIQIDDGYQPWMGDWLSHGKAFDGGVDQVLRTIRNQNLEPALWVAPFIASPQSQLFKDHPDWMIKDANGKPLRSDTVGFGGWRQGPWYALDGTHPEVQKFLESLFHKLRTEWGCTYFKLDANYWGALPGGYHHDPKATRIDAYRRGMEAILRGSGDAFLLGCNHPMWPSLGLIHGGRSSNDIHLNWQSFSSVARQNLMRNWQNGKFWWNDPDTINLHDSQCKDVIDPSGMPITTGKIPENEYLFHATATYASGGMMLSGDDLTKITPRRLEILKKLVPAQGISAHFDNDSLDVGVTTLPNCLRFSVFNWSDQPANRSIQLPPGKWALKDFWTNETLGIHSGSYSLPPFGPRSARLIEATQQP